MTSTPTFTVSEILKTTNSNSSSPTIASGYGHSIDADGNTMVVGTYGGNRFFIYDYDGTSWNQVNEFSKPATAPGRFGMAVAISGEWIAVTDANYSTSFNATITMYRKVSGNWIEYTTITNPVTSPGYGFGQSIALKDGTLVIGKIEYTTSSAGGAFVYVWDGTNWVDQSGFLTVPSSEKRQSNQFLGADVAIEGDTIVVGGPGSNSGVSGGKGIAFIAKRIGTTWSVTEILKPSTSYNDAYGAKVKIQGTKVLIAATTGNATEAIPGQVFLYDISGSNATLEATFTVKSDTSQLIQDTLITTNALYGSDIDFSFDGSVIAVGAGNRYVNRGIVYFYEKVDGVWGVTALPTNSWLTASDSQFATGARFGNTMKFAADGLMIGAYGVKSTYWFK